MLAESSMNSTRSVPPLPSAVERKLDSKNGRAQTKTISMMIRQRSSSSSRCSIFILRRRSRMASSRNSIAAQSMMRNFRRLSRWMMIGIEIRPEPIRNSGLMKLMS